MLDMTDSSSLQSASVAIFSNTIEINVRNVCNTELIPMVVNINPRIGSISSRTCIVSFHSRCEKINMGEYIAAEGVMCMISKLAPETTKFISTKGREISW